MNLPLIALGIVLVAVVTLLWQRQVAFRREQFIRSFPLPPGLYARFLKHHPHLTEKEREQ